jgi:hypothetical protein
MNPFEQAQSFVSSLAENMYACYAMMQYLPYVQTLEYQAAVAHQTQNIAAIQELAIIQKTLQQQINILSYDA